MPLSLFALTNDPARRIVKFELSNPVQSELTDYIQDQEQDFDEATEEFEFDGNYKPDAGEVLYINNYDDIDGLEQAVDNPLARISHSVSASFANQPE